MAEVDLIDRYVACIADELTDGGIRHRVVNTRKAPGTHPDDRFHNVFDYCLPITCAIGFNDAKKIKQHYNTSFVLGNEEMPRRFMDELSEVVGHWGSLYVHGHKTASPQVQKDLGIRIEPFLINGPSATEYAQRLTQLGRDIGRYLSDFLRSRGDAAVFSVNRQAPVAKKA
jgi:hypothetical protein